MVDALSVLREEVEKQFSGCDYIVDLSNLVFRWASPRALEMTGYTAADFDKIRSLDLADPEFITEEEFRKQLEERVAAGHGENTYVVKTKDGQKMKARVAYQIIHFDGKVYLAGKVLEASKI